MAGEWGEEEHEQTATERLQGEIDRLEEAVAKKKAYLEFLKANPQFVEYERLKSEAR